MSIPQRLFALVVLSLLAPLATASPVEESWLREQDQALLAGIHNGDKKLWSDLTTSDFIYIEEGELTTRAELLDELTPDGHEPLRITEFTVSQSKDVAMVVHEDALPADEDNPRPGALYLMAETWRIVDGNWKLQIRNVYAIHTAPPAITLSSREIDQVVGRYAHGKSSFSIISDGGKLVMVRGSGRHLDWVPETHESFYTTDELRERWIISFAEDGRIRALIERDENSDSIYLKQDDPNN